MNAIRTVVYCLPLACGNVARACPFCEGTGGVNPVRNGIFDADFWPNIGAMVLPFVLLLGLVTVIYFGGSREQQ